jgi:hypothetical protein
MQEKGIIYKVTDIENEKIYIGQTGVGLRKRQKDHLRSAYKKFEDLRKGKIEDFNEDLFSIQYYLKGEENFEWEIIDGSYTQNSLNEKEAYWIQYYRNLGCEMYNIAGGGHHVFPSSIYYNGAINDETFNTRETIEEKINDESYYDTICYNEDTLTYMEYISNHLDEK